MIVYTYFEPVKDIDFLEESRLASQWRKSWVASGFSPMTLTSQIAESHPKYFEYVKLVRALPSVNPAGYDLACWLRWLALDVVGGGLMTDHDMIARAFDPEFLAFANPITVLDRGLVPCAVFTTKAGATQLVDDILEHDHKHDGKHYSDMYFFQAKGYPRDGDLTAPYGAADWKLAPAVHFSHADCGREQPGRPRSTIVWEEMFAPPPSPAGAIA